MVTVTNPKTTVQRAVYVYQASIRIWHWINAFAIITLCITGYFIGSPLPTLSGEASDHYLMGYIRFTHFAAGYIVAAFFIFRLYWAFVGNKYAKQIFFPPIFQGEFWNGLWHEVKWYLFLTNKPRKYVGHNPLATLSMHIFYVWGITFMIFTGFALYGEGEGMQSWQFRFFTSWLQPLLGQSQGLHTWHHLGMWWMVCFIMVHVYSAIREDIMSRQSMISTMISGWRTFKDRGPSDDTF